MFHGLVHGGLVSLGTPRSLRDGLAACACGCLQWQWNAVSPAGSGDQAMQEPGLAAPSAVLRGKT